jgi:hypothetical protein
LQSILKEEKIEVDVFAISHIRRLFFNHYITYQDESLNKYSVVRKKIGNYTLLKGLSESLHIPKEIEAYREIYKRYFPEIQDFVNKREVVAKTPIEENTYIFLTEILLLEIIKARAIEGKSVVSFLNRFNNLTENRFNIIVNAPEQGVKHSKKGRASIMDIASNAIVWTRKDRQPISYEINELLAKINPVLVEIPQDYDKNKLITALSKINDTLIRFSIIDREFSLKFKKLGAYKKKGMYIKPSQSIILDVRHINLFQHELGHYLYEEGVVFWLDGEKYNRNKMESIVAYQKLIGPELEKQISNHMRDIEGYKLDSEIFANWFEKIIC